jgi:plasmid replication initiation protein
MAAMVGSGGGLRLGRRAGQGASQLPAVRSSDFFLCDILDALPKDDMATMEHPVFSLATRPDLRVLSYAHNGVDITVTPSVRGLATIHDKDILIFCISQLMAALNAGRAVARTVTLKAHDLLVATNRETSGDAYRRLRDSFERLAGTRITTNLAVDGQEVTRGFGLIESWEIVRKTRGGRMISVSVTLSDWRQDSWRVSVEVLLKKSGSASPRRVFRAMLREMIAADHLPDYAMTEEPGDIIRFTNRAAVLDTGEGPSLPPLSSDALDAGRALAPGWDIHALEADWRTYWAASGRPRLRSAERAFLGYVKARMGGGAG